MYRPDPEPSGASAASRGSSGGELTRRILVAAFGVPLAVVMVWQGGWFMAIIMAVVAGMGAREFYALAESRSVRPLMWPGVAMAVSLPLLAVFRPTLAGFAPWLAAVAVGGGLAALGASVWLRGVEGGPMASFSTTVAGAIYTGGTLAFALLLRHLPDSPPGVGAAADLAGSSSSALDPIHGGFLVAFPITVTWISDSAAFFAGTRWGRTKLVPRISPGKTVEGGVAALLAAVLTAALFVLLFMDSDRPFGMGVPFAAVSGLMIGVTAQIGDLAESVLKREAGVKDSGAILPGHGGVLDRFDALFFTVPLGYLLVVLHLHL